MINFEEFKASYKETISLCISMIGVPEDAVFQFDLAWDFKDNEEKKSAQMNIENMYMIDIPINFQLQGTDRPFYITIATPTGEFLCQSLKCTLQDLLSDGSFALTKEFSSGGILKV